MRYRNTSAALHKNHKKKNETHLVALITAPRFFVGVRKHVSLQARLTVECLCAYGTSVVLLMYKHSVQLLCVRSYRPRYSVVHSMQVMQSHQTGNCCRIMTNLSQIQLELVAVAAPTLIRESFIHWVTRHIRRSTSFW